MPRYLIAAAARTGAPCLPALMLKGDGLTRESILPSGLTRAVAVVAVIIVVLVLIVVVVVVAVVRVNLGSTRSLFTTQQICKLLHLAYSLRPACRWLTDDLQLAYSWLRRSVSHLFELAVATVSKL